MHESPTVRALALTKREASARRLTILLYAVAACLYWMSLYLYVPTLPTYTQSKSDSLALVGIVISMYGLWQAIIRLPLGIAADAWGRRKPFIVGGLVLGGLGAWVMGSAGDIEGLVIGRSMTGLAAGTWVPLVVVFSSLFPPREAMRASAILTLVGSIGRVLGTSVTGSLNELGGYSLAFVVACGTAVLAILVVLPAREQRRPSRRPSLPEVRAVISRRDVILPSLLNALAQYANWAVTFTFLPILAKQLGASDIALSMLVSTHVGITILGNLVATGLINRLGAQTLIALGLILLSGGIGASALATSLLPLFALQFCIGLAMGVVYPVLMGMSIQHVEDSQRTMAMGLHQSVYAVGMFAGPWVSGWLADLVGIRPTLGITAFACLSLGMLLSRALARK